MSNPRQRPSARPAQTTRARVNARRPAQRRPRPQRSLRRYVAIAAGVVAVLALLVLMVVWRQADQALKTIEQEDPRRRQTAVPAPVVGGQLVAPQTQPDLTAPAAPPSTLQAPVNILLIGVDKRPTESEDDGARTDTLIVVHLDPQQQWASMLSIPRDSVAQIPRFGPAKINAAYTAGWKNAEGLYGPGTTPDAAGGALAAETVEAFLGVPIDYVAQVDFRGFEQLVNVIGGVLVDVPRPLLDPEYPTEDYGVERIYIPPGLQVLDGHTALVYARSRHSSSDFDRSVRQQQVLRALLEQVKARDLLENAALLPQWADVLAENVRTTLPVSDLSMLNGLATLARALDSSRIVQISINPDTARVDAENGSDIYWNKADIAAVVARWEAGPQGTPSAPGLPSVGGAAAMSQAVTVQVLNGTSTPGLAEQVSGQLQSQGFDMIAPADWASVYQHTTVIDYSDKPAARAQIAETLGVGARYVEATPGPDAPAQDGSADIIVIVGQDYREP